MSSGPQRAPGATLRVGLTGGVASGKSTVAQRFAALGVPVIDADVVARELTQSDTPLLGEIAQRFGPLAEQRLGQPLLKSDGTLDRTLLRRMIFDDPVLRRELEELLHPQISARMQQLGRELDGPYQIHVVPLLVETGAGGRYDRVLVVDSPEALQLSRLQTRDTVDLRQAQAMLRAQTPRAIRLTVADDIITNANGLEALVAQVAALDRKYRELASARALDR